MSHTLKTNNDSYKIKEKIGEGGFGEVFTATSSKTGIDVIIKMVLDKTSAEQERTILFQIKKDCEKYLVCIIDFYQRMYESYIILKLIPNVIDLYDIQWNLGKNSPDLPERIVIAFKLLEGLYVLHKNNVVHRDIKPENIICDQNLNGHYIDYGLSCSLDSKTVQEEDCLRNLCGTRDYVSSQILKLKIITLDLNEVKQILISEDVYALGCVFYELLLSSRIDELGIHMPIFRKVSMKKLEKLINSMPYPDRLSLQIVKGMTNPDWKKRDTLDQIIQKINDYKIPPQVFKYAKLLQIPPKNGMANAVQKSSSRNKYCSSIK